MHVSAKAVLGYSFFLVQTTDIVAIFPPITGWIDRKA